MFQSIKNSGEVLSKLKSRGFCATSLSTYDFSTLYTISNYNLKKEKNIDLLSMSSNSSTTLKVHFILPVTIRKCFSLLQTIKDINFGLVRMYVTSYLTFRIIFTSNLVRRYSDKLLVF